MLLRILKGAGVIIIMLGMVIIFGANVWSWIGGFFHKTSSAQENAGKINVQEIDYSNSRHFKIVSRFINIWPKTVSTDTKPQLYIVVSPEINAASLGGERFIFWESLADMPDWAIDAIVAHEIAHDLLNHSKKARELQDLTNFFAEVLALFGHSSREEEKTIRGWVNLAVLPKYSRSQELEADTKSLELLSLSGYENPNIVLYRTFEIMLTKQGDSGGSFFDSHPSTRERMNKLKI